MFYANITGGNMIKLFALDMDGTLLDSKSRLREETIDALKDLQASGGRVLLCSGRKTL